MPRTYQNTPLPGSNGKDVSGGYDVLRTAPGIDGHPDGMGSIMGRDTGGDPVAGLNGNRKRGIKPGPVTAGLKGKL